MEHLQTSVQPIRRRTNTLVDSRHKKRHKEGAILEEIENDIGCLTCKFGEYNNIDKWGNPLFIRCSLKNENKAIDETCEDYE